MRTNRRLPGLLVRGVAVGATVIAIAASTVAGAFTTSAQGAAQSAKSSISVANVWYDF